MEVIFENVLGYSVIMLLAVVFIALYVRRNRHESETTISKIRDAKKYGFYEPVSLHPVVDTDMCIGSGACIKACPEKDILGIVNGQAHVINASRCVGHGACFHACPFQAISLCIGTEKRGVELPHVSQQFETNVPGLYIAGELGGMGLIKNAVEQGKQAVSYFEKKVHRDPSAEYDIIIIGAGPAGISASLTAAEKGLRYLTLEQDSLGGTVYSFPRAKVIMTSPMDLPLYGKVKLRETSKSDLLQLWNSVLQRNDITINEFEKVESVEKSGGVFKVMTVKGSYTSSGVIMAIGRRGSPRKLGVKGEDKEKVAYRLIEPEHIRGKHVLVVGGGDSAAESALLLSEVGGNNVTLSYRGTSFSRLKPKNLERINESVAAKKINAVLNSNVKEILDDKVLISKTDSGKTIEIPNELVYVFAGGSLPSDFLQKAGIKITKKFGEAILKHQI